MLFGTTWGEDSISVLGGKNKTCRFVTHGKTYIKKKPWICEKILENYEVMIELFQSLISFSKKKKWNKQEIWGKLSDKRTFPKAYAM